MDRLKSQKTLFIAQALLAAVFFGASAPFTKILLGKISPVFLAAFLYLGSGSGIGRHRRCVGVLYVLHLQPWLSPGLKNIACHEGHPQSTDN